MSELNFKLVGKEKNWSFAREEVRVGRDPGCDLVLPSEDYPMVSARHLRVRLQGEAYWVEDLGSRNGTFVNGRRIERERLAPGDTLRLGSDGPELRVEFTAVPAGTRTPAPGTATLGGPTRPGAPEVPPPTPTRPGPPGTPPTRAAPSPSPQPSLEELSPGEEAMIEQRLNTLRNLLAAALVLILALGGVVIYQAQQINRNHQAIQDLRNEANTVLARMAPELDERLNSFEARMDEMQTAMDELDGKIKKAEDRMMNRLEQAEDRMVARLEQELPRILDAYIEKKLKEIQERAPQRRR